MKGSKKEIVFYSLILVILIVIVVLNNVFFKIGKESEEIQDKQEVEQLEIDNITYNVPFEEKWLD